MTLAIPKGRKPKRMDRSAEIHFALPKAAPFRSQAYLDFIKSQPCFVTGKRASEQESVVYAHFRIGTDGGTASKPSDWFTMPLCASEHDKQHRGELTYWREVLQDERCLSEVMKGYMLYRYGLWVQENG